MAHSAAMCPGPRALYSATKVRVSASTRSTVSGSPTSLLNEFSGATVGPSAPNTAANRSFVEVLPDEPVTPTTRHAARRRTSVASCQRLLRVVDDDRGSL